MPFLIPLEKKNRFYVFLPIELVCCIILCRKAILRYSDFLHGQSWHLWCGPEAMGCGCELARKATPHSFWPIALLGAKDWPWFSYNLKLKVLTVYVCSHSSWGNKPWISSFVFWPWKGSSCLSLLIYLICSMNVRQSSLSFQRTLPYIVHTTKTFNLCVLHPPSTGNICCALIFFYLFIKKILFFSK